MMPENVEGIILCNTAKPGVRVFHVRNIRCKLLTAYQIYVD